MMNTAQIFKKNQHTKKVKNKKLTSFIKALDS